MVDLTAARLIPAFVALAAVVAAATALAFAWIRAQRDALRRRMVLALNTLAEQLLESQSAREVYARLAEALPNALPVNAVELYTLDRATRSLAAVPGPEAPRWDSLASRAVEHAAKAMDGRVMAIPAAACVLVAERARGVFTEDEVPALTHLANQASAAIDRAAEVRLRDRVMHVAGEEAAAPVEVRGLLSGLVRYRERDWKRLGVEVEAAIEGAPLWAAAPAGQLERRVLEQFADVEQQAPCKLRIAVHATSDGVAVEVADAAWTLPATAAPQPLARSTKKLTLLVAEPQAALRARMVDDLSATGHRVVPVPDAEQAADIARRVHFDAIVCGRSAGPASLVDGLAPRVVIVDDWTPEAVLATIERATP